MQIINLPNLCIIDFGFGFTGSTHDSTAWEKTRVFEDHETIFEEGEFIWADSAYPVRILSVTFKSSLNSEIYSDQIQTWMVAPYKRPKSDIPGNEVFNNRVSIIRICSEHAIGCLKGRFQSLKGLRINIKDKKTHKFATYWVVACIGVHAFAMKCEAEESGDRDEDYQDPFIVEGLFFLPSSDESDNPPPVAARGTRRGGTLAAAKRKREALQRRWFRWQERRGHHGNMENLTDVEVSSADDDT